MKVSFVIVNYHGLCDTRACLESLGRLKTNHDWNSLVVNVESESEGKELEQHSDATVLDLDENLGYSGANNLGIRHAIDNEAEIVVLLNNDTVVDEHMLDPLVGACIEPGVGMVSPKIYFSAGREFHHDQYKEDERGNVIWYAGGIIDWSNVYAFHWGVNEVDHGQFNETVDTDFATGCCLATRADVIEDIGMLDEGYFLYLEDVDWSIRAKRSSYRVVFEPRSMVWHKNAGSTGGSGSELQQRYQAKSKLRFARKHAPFRAKIAVYREYIKNRKIPIGSGHPE